MRECSGCHELISFDLTICPYCGKKESKIKLKKYKVARQQEYIVHSFIHPKKKLVVLGKKSIPVGIICLILAIAGILAFVLRHDSNRYIPFLLSEFIAFFYIITPFRIYYDDDDKLIIAGLLKIPLQDIKKVSAKEHASTGVSYYFGSVTITTKHWFYTFPFMSNCVVVKNGILNKIKNSCF